MAKAAPKPASGVAVFTVRAVNAGIGTRTIVLDPHGVEFADAPIAEGGVMLQAVGPGPWSDLDPGQVVQLSLAVVK